MHVSQPPLTVPGPTAGVENLAAVEIGGSNAHGHDLPDRADTRSSSKIKRAADRLALMIATAGGVGYMPLVPATWASLVTAVLYFFLSEISQTWRPVDETSAKATIAVLIVALLSIGIWASSRVVGMTRNKDPKIVVVDEVVGQLITFLFIPFGAGWVYMLAGFFAFRLFDIWKPFPARQLERLSAGLGVMADDVMAGVYAGGAMALLFLELHG